MNKIIVYEHENFTGLHREFTSDVPDLHSVDFGDCISSLKVIGQPWLVFSDAEYKGLVHAYEEGEYKSISLNDSISSLQLVSEDLDHPQITLFEKPNFEGTSKIITEETNLIYGYFNDKAASHIVQKGVWILYEHGNRRGSQYIAREGNKLSNYDPMFHFNKKCSYVYPLKGGQAIVTSNILWDHKKVESERDIVIDEINGVNDTNFEQAFTTTTSKIYESATSHSFKLKPSSLKINGSFYLSIDPSTNLLVEKGSIESTVTIDKIEVSMPAKIPPHSELNIRVIRQVVNASVPVELTITKNGKMKTECGEYRSMSGSNISTRYIMKPIEKKT
ncbi:epidermal differentiation-specific protein-like [Eublepharis macularius]|uniref:Epidermal differentiation-specific protein-like n=1 Tax=Eublepharis macularius TaxID=481883 RepID=A0AA97KWP6_EUBMA|nr:epidermal differentiation-specific protein-like [Eublepharis macularius]